jgi:Ca-activated chloride channel homolog
MDRRTAVLSLWAACAGSMLFAAPGISSQESKSKRRKPDPDDEATFRSEAVLVLLDVGVRDRKGNLVPGLAPEHFTVLEDGRPQKITVFDAEDRPVTLGILLDQSLSMMPKYHEVMHGARTLIEESHPRDEVFILHFSDTVKAGLPARLPFSSDRRALLTALGSVTPGGRTALYDGLWEALIHIRKGKRGRKAIVLLSDGGDTASRRKRGEAIAAVEQSIATIYTIGLYSPGDPDRDPGFLRRVATLSGGEASLPSSPEQVLTVCRQIAKEIRSRYTVGYIPQRPDGTSGMRRIDVRVRHPQLGRLTVRTRRGYRVGLREDAG